MKPRRRKKSGRPGIKSGETAVNGMNHSSSKKLAFFKTCPWDKWWNEFNTAREPNGRMKYSTAWQFVKAKAKTSLEAEWIYRCIGPKPIDVKLIGLKKRKNKLPYLGDWQVQRAKAYFYDNESVDKIRKVVAEKMDGLEAGRGSATIILDLIAKWMKYDDKLDEVFNFPTDASMKESVKERMATRFFTVKNRTRHAIQELVTQFLQCHGINSDGGMNDLGALVMAVSQSATRGALQGVATGAMAAEGSFASPAAALIANSIADKSKMFSMKLPEIVLEHKDEE